MKKIGIWRFLFDSLRLSFTFVCCVDLSSGNKNCMFFCSFLNFMLWLGFDIFLCDCVCVCVCMFLFVDLLSGNRNSFFFDFFLVLICWYFSWDIKNSAGFDIFLCDWICCLFFWIYRLGNRNCIFFSFWLLVVFLEIVILGFNIFFCY